MSHEENDAYEVGYNYGIAGKIVDGAPTEISQNPSLHKAWLNGFIAGQLERANRVNNGLSVPE